MNQQQQNLKVEQKKKDKEEEQERVEEHILRRYELSDFKGKGAYGIVWKAIDRKTQQVVALKKIFDAFHNSTDAQRTFREVIFLEQLTQHDNIVKLINVIKADNDKDLYMIFEFMETDLHKVIRAGILENIHKKYITYQIIKGLKYIHSGDLIHRDLKPSNLLIDSLCKIKVADFGLARTINSTDEDSPIMTEYVATRWYRAPEILMGSQRYTKAVDMWSVGCIVGEMMVGKALFPGNSTLNQIEQVINLIGRPNSSDFEAMLAPQAQHIIDNMQTQKKKTFAQQFSAVSREAIDLIRKCLTYDPDVRLTVEEALKHPYIREFAGKEPENVCSQRITSLIDDNHKLNTSEYRQALYSHLNSKRKQYDRFLHLKVKETIERLNSSPLQKTRQQQQPISQDTFENVETIKRYQQERPRIVKRSEDGYQEIVQTVTQSLAVSTVTHMIPKQTLVQKYHHKKSQSQSQSKEKIYNSIQPNVISQTSSQLLFMVQESEPQTQNFTQQHRRIVSQKLALLNSINPLAADRPEFRSSSGFIDHSKKNSRVSVDPPIKAQSRTSSFIDKKLKTQVITPISCTNKTPTNYQNDLLNGSSVKINKKEFFISYNRNNKVIEQQKIDLQNKFLNIKKIRL